MRNGLLVLSLIFFVAQSCTTYSVLPKNISNHSSIEGVYSNMSETDSERTYSYTRSLWSVIDHKREIKADSISVKVEIINSKELKFSFFRDDEIVGIKWLKGKFKEDECFYTRRVFYVIPILPILWGYGNFQKRIYRVDNELIIEMVGNHGGVAIIMAGGDKYDDILSFKQIDNE